MAGAASSAPTGETASPLSRAAKTPSIISDGGPSPYKVKVRAPSFSNLHALSEITRGGLMGDVVAAIGSIDIVLGEIDR